MKHILKDWPVITTMLFVKLIVLWDFIVIHKTIYKKSKVNTTTFSYPQVFNSVFISCRLYKVFHLNVIILIHIILFRTIAIRSPVITTSYTWFLKKFLLNGFKHSVAHTFLGQWQKIRYLSCNKKGVVVCSLIFQHSLYCVKLSGFINKEYNYQMCRVTTVNLFKISFIISLKIHSYTFENISLSQTICLLP